jgi:hypothetical protein
MPSGLLHSEFDNEVIPLHAKGHQRWKCPFKDGNGLKDVEPSDTNWMLGMYGVPTVIDQ